MIGISDEDGCSLIVIAIIGDDERVIRRMIVIAVISDTDLVNRGFS